MVGFFIDLNGKTNHKFPVTDTEYSNADEIYCSTVCCTSLHLCSVQYVATELLLVYECVILQKCVGITCILLAIALGYCIPGPWQYWVLSSDCTCLVCFIHWMLDNVWLCIYTRACGTRANMGQI